MHEDSTQRFVGLQCFKF